MGWRVALTADSEAELRETFQKGLINTDDIAILKKWVSEVETLGIESTQLNRTWRDHELMGKWKGHRSMTFSFKGRLIYRIEHDVVVVRVVRITADHNYR